MEEYAVYFVTYEGEFDRSPIDVFDNYESAENRAMILSMENPEDREVGEFVVVEH